MKNRIVTRLTLTLLALGLSSPALATDGVLEINQICAMNTGCFSGDTPGFPVVITYPGSGLLTPSSYRLTSDLIVPSTNVNGIEVGSSFTNNVSIDLNGFQIISAGCVNATSSACMPTSGSGAGIRTGWTTNRGISVKNGSITGMGGAGVEIYGSQVQITNLRVRWNRLQGLLVLGGGAIVSGNTTYQNGSHGIYVNEGSTILGNTAYENGSDGLRTAAGCTIKDNATYNNTGSGIKAGEGAIVSGNNASYNTLTGIEVASSGNTVKNNTVNRNGVRGISAGSGSTLIGNTAFNNTAEGIYVGGYGSTVKNNSTRSNGSDGITVAGNGSNIRDNTSRDNGGYGLNISGSTESGYGGNVFSNNTSGHVNGGTQLGENLCGGSICP